MIWKMGSKFYNCHIFFMTIIIFATSQRTPNSINVSDQPVQSLGEISSFTEQDNFQRNISFSLRKKKSSQQIQILKLWDNIRKKQDESIEKDYDSDIDIIHPLMMKWLAMRYRPKFHVNGIHSGILPRDFIENIENDEKLTLRLIGPNIVLENTSAIYTVKIEPIADNGLNMSKVKYLWYLHNVESPNNNNNINISLLKEESLSKMESSLEITFPSLRKYNKNEANGQYIINVVLQVDGQHNNNNNGVGYVHAVGNNTNNSLNGANSSSNHMDSIVFMVTKFVTVSRLAKNNNNSTPEQEAYNDNEIISHGRRIKRQYEEQNNDDDDDDDELYLDDDFEHNSTIQPVHLEANENIELELDYPTTATSLSKEKVNTSNSNSDDDNDNTDYGESFHELKQPTSTPKPTTTILPSVSATPTRMLTKDEIIQLINGTEQLILEGKMNKSMAKKFLNDIHVYAENLCRIQGNNNDQSDHNNSEEPSVLIIPGLIITIQIEQITKQLEKYLASKSNVQFKSHFYNNKTRENNENHLEIEFGRSFQQYCSEVNKKYTCQPLCFVTINMQGIASDLFQEKTSDSVHSESFSIWETFLVKGQASNITFVDPDHEIQFYEPVRLRFSISEVPKNKSAFCSRWNKSGEFWESWDKNSTCIESKLIAPNLLECKCQRLGHFKVQYIEGEGNVPKEIKPKILTIRINGSFDEIVGKNQSKFQISIHKQLLNQLKLNDSNNIENLQVIKKTNGTVLIRFKLNIGDPKKEKESVNYFKQLLENSSLNLIDLHGNSLSIPPHYLEDLHDEPQEISDSEVQITLASGLVIGILLIGAIIFIGTAAVRKYKKERENSVRRVKQSSNVFQTHFPTFHSSLTHPNIETRIDPISNSVTRSASFTSEIMTTFSSATNRNKNLKNNNRDSNQNSQPREIDISVVDVNPNAVPAYSLKSFPNSTIH